jgi:hypothetical protein
MYDRLCQEFPDDIWEYKTIPIEDDDRDYIPFFGNIQDSVCAHFKWSYGLLHIALHNDIFDLNDENHRLCAGQGCHADFLERYISHQMPNKLIRDTRKEVIHSAAFHGDLSLLKKLIQDDKYVGLFGIDTMDYAALGNQLDVVVFLHDAQYIAHLYAACYSYLDILQYLRRCYDEEYSVNDVLQYAAIGGSLDVLKLHSDELAEYGEGVIQSLVNDASFYGRSNVIVFLKDTYLSPKSQ